MEYRDVMHIIPSSFLWRTPSPGSYKPDEGHQHDQEYFKWNYKTGYKDSPYYLRLNIRPEREYNNPIITNIEFTEKDVETYAKRIPNFKRNIMILIPVQHKHQSFDTVDYHSKSVEERRSIANRIIYTQTEQAKYNIGQSLINIYFPIADFMTDKQADPFEGRTIWKQFYLDHLQILYNEDVRMCI
jgi:hypothetical protein